MDEIMCLADFWQHINNKDSAADVENNEEATASGDERYVISKEARKYLHCLSCYPNEFWKYATSVFFIKNKDIGRTSFDAKFCSMLKKLVAFLFVKFINTPSVNAIKDDIYGECISIQAGNGFQARPDLNEEQLAQQIEEHSSSRLSRALLLLDAYLHQDQHTLIPDPFEIEHILPKKWQDTNYHGWTVDDAKLYLDKFGNKIVCEKKYNIQAGHSYFGLKKEKYRRSMIACVHEMSNYQKNDWNKEDIELRGRKIKSNLIGFFKKHLAKCR